MPQAVTLLGRAAAFRPRFVRDAIVLGKSTVLARRVVERGCYCVEKPDHGALTTLLSLAYEKRISSDDPMAHAILRAAAVLLRNPEHVDALLAHLPEPAPAGIAQLPQAEHLLKTETRPANLAKAMRRDRLGLRPVPAYADRLTLCDKGVVLGKGTVIAALEDSADVGLVLKGREGRILALLSVASNLAIDADVLAKFEGASRALGGGNVTLAAIHLAQAGLPPLAHTGLAKALSLAADELSRGTGPFELLKGLDLLPAEMGYADWSPVLRKEGGGNPNHRGPGPGGGEFCSAGEAHDGTSGKNGANTKLDVIKQKIREALQGKKAIALVGGAGDEGNGPIAGIKDKFERQYPDASVQYFPNTDDDRLTAWLAGQSKQFGGDNVAIVGHSYGGDTAASVVADGTKVGTLVTIDPVSNDRPDLNDVRGNAGTWINVNANPDDATRAQEHGNGNFLAGIGGAWDSAPAKYATQHYNANMNHAEAYKALLNVNP